MAHASAKDLRQLLSVAGNLRDLAARSLTSEADRTLFAAAAGALEARARWLATSLPGDRPPEASSMHQHPHVDLLV